MSLSFQALQDLWKQAGGSAASAPVAAAIALAESGGRPDAHNPKPPDDSYGLWQINMLGSLGPARRRQYGLSSNDQLYDPMTNAKAAVAISGGGKSFAAWSTFTNGAYRSHLNGQGAGGDTPTNWGSALGVGGTGSNTGGVQQAGFITDLLGTIFSGGNSVLGQQLSKLFSTSADIIGSSPLSGFLGPLAAIGSAFALFGKFMNFVLTKLFLPSTWVRVAAFGFGVMMIMAGLFVFFVGAAPIRAAERIVSDVI